MQESNQIRNSQMTFESTPIEKEPETDEPIHVMKSCINILLSLCATSRRKKTNLARGHGLGDHSLQGKLLLLQVVRGGLLNLKLGHGIAKGGLDLVLGTTLELEGHGGVGDDLLNSRDVGLELLLSLELLAESLVAVLELLGI